MDMKDKSVHEKAILYDRILRDTLDSQKGERKISG